MSVFGWHRPARHLAARFGARAGNGTEPGSRGGAVRRIRASSGVVSAGARRPRRTLKGNQAQEGRDLSQRRQRREEVPDSAAEQGLEGEARRESGGPNTREATATVTWCGCRRGSSFEGYETDVAGKSMIESGRCLRAPGIRVHIDRNATNPRIGSGAQQTRERPEEEAAEVVRTHEGGTCGGGGTLSAEAEPRGPAGVDSGSHVDEGAIRRRAKLERAELAGRIPREEGQNTLTRAVQEL